QRRGPLGQGGGAFERGQGLPEHGKARRVIGQRYVQIVAQRRAQRRFVAGAHGDGFQNGGQGAVTASGEQAGERGFFRSQPGEGGFGHIVSIAQLVGAGLRGGAGLGGGFQPGFGLNNGGFRRFDAGLGFALGRIVRR